MMSPDLRGLRVLVTRPQPQAEALARLIEAAGGEAIRFPVVEILAPADSRPLLALIERLHEFDLAIFISPNAVNRALNLVKARRDWPAPLPIACVGKGSAKELKHFGLTPAIVPQGRFDSEALLEEPQLKAVDGKNVVIFRGDGGREVLANTLAERGARVEYAECYRRVKPNVDTAPLLRRWARGEIDLVTVTSAEALRNLYDLLGKLGQQWLVKTPAVVVSERIAQICRELGFKSEVMVSPQASDESIVQTLRAWSARRAASG